MQKDIALPKYIFQKAELILAQLQIHMYQRRMRELINSKIHFQK